MIKLCIQDMEEQEREGDRESDRGKKMPCLVMGCWRTCRPEHTLTHNVFTIFVTLFLDFLRLTWIILRKSKQNKQKKQTKKSYHCLPVSSQALQSTGLRRSLGDRNIAAIQHVSEKHNNTPVCVYVWRDTSRTGSR